MRQLIPRADLPMLKPVTLYMQVLYTGTQPPLVLDSMWSPLKSITAGCQRKLEQLEAIVALGHQHATSPSRNY
jgi:hypothetical protein